MQEFMMNLMGRMVQATEAATVAAQQAATVTSRAMSSGDTTSGGSRTTDEWYKLLNKPACFSPTNREEEIQQFRDWFWTLEQFLGAVDSEFCGDISRIRANVNQPVEFSSLTEAGKRRSTMLYGGLLKNRPLLLLKSVSNNNGLEAVRCLISTLQPNTRNRSLALLNNIMQWSQFSMKEALLGQVLRCFS